MPRSRGWGRKVQRLVWCGRRDVTFNKVVMARVAIERLTSVIKDSISKIQLLVMAAGNRVAT